MVLTDDLIWLTIQEYYYNTNSEQSNTIQQILWDVLCLNKRIVKYIQHAYCDKHNGGLVQETI